MLTDLKEEVDNTIEGTLLLHCQQWIDHPNGKIKKMLKMNHTLDQMVLKETYRTVSSTSAEYTFFSSAYGTLPRIEHVKGHQTS